MRGCSISLASAAILASGGTVVIDHRRARPDSAASAWMTRCPIALCASTPGGIDAVGQRLGRLASDGRCARRNGLWTHRGKAGRSMRASFRSASISAEGPTVEWRRLHRDQHQVGCEQRRAHEAGDTRQTVDHDF